MTKKKKDLFNIGHESTKIDLNIPFKMPESTEERKLYKFITTYQLGGRIPILGEPFLSDASKNTTSQISQGKHTDSTLLHQMSVKTTHMTAKYCCPQHNSKR